MTTTFVTVIHIFIMIWPLSLVVTTIFVTVIHILINMIMTVISSCDHYICDRYPYFHHHDLAVISSCDHYICDRYLSL